MYAMRLRVDKWQYDEVLLETCCLVFSVRVGGAYTDVRH